MIDFELLKEGYWAAWVELITIIVIPILIFYMGYLFVTGQDAYSVDNKLFQSAKNDCSKLKDYLLIHPDDFHSDAARSIYLVNCK